MEPSVRRPENFTEKSIRVILSALGAYLNEVVVCGSWTNFIYRHWMTPAPWKPIGKEREDYPEHAGHP